ncbi:MAG: hypothetical protein WAW88_17255 [Nocardioides sp.]
MSKTGEMRHGEAMRRYLLASVALGVIATWASENLFWSAPPERGSALEFGITCVAYGICCAAALTAVLVTGVGGWVAVFGGACLLGWLVEGVVVDTMYAAVPFQLVWTPVAWHGLVSGLLILGLSRAAGRWPVLRHLGACLLVGLMMGVWAWYWPGERGPLVADLRSTAYLVVPGLAAVGASLLLDRVGEVSLPRRRWVAWLAPGLLAAVWTIKLVASGNPILLMLPLVVLAALWVLRRLGRPGQPLSLGPAGGWRHLNLLAVPLVATGIGAWGWAAYPQGVAVNVGLATALSGIGVGLWWVLLRRALRTERAPTGVGSDPPAPGLRS